VFRLPLPLDAKLWILFAGGIFLIAFGAAILLTFFSEKSWIRSFQIEEKLKKYSNS